MEITGHIEKDPGPLASTRTDAPLPEKLKKRRELFDLQMRRMYLSAGQPVPGEITLTLRVEDAMLLWERIPDEALSAVVTRALIEAEGFVPGNGHVVRTWRDMREEADAKAREEKSQRDRETFAKLPKVDPDAWTAVICECRQAIGE